MTIHYHGTPITPAPVLRSLAGRHFCVSHARPDNVIACHQLGQSVMLDNGAFSAWTSGRKPDWPAYYAWCDAWFAYPTTWGVVPDVIDAPEDAQNALLAQWPHGRTQGAPVWHMNESLSRLLSLIDSGWYMVCIGSTSIYARVMSDVWRRRMDDVWDTLLLSYARTPRIHMLRGLQCVSGPWPFASVDSTDIARNHHLPKKNAAVMADRWDGLNCPGKWRY